MGGRSGEALFNGHRVSAWEDENLGGICKAEVAQHYECT